MEISSPIFWRSCLWSDSSALLSGGRHNALSGRELQGAAFLIKPVDPASRYLYCNEATSHCLSCEVDFLSEGYIVRSSVLVDQAFDWLLNSGAAERSVRSRLILWLGVSVFDDEPLILPGQRVPRSICNQVARWSPCHTGCFPLASVADRLGIHRWLWKIISAL